MEQGGGDTYSCTLSSFTPIPRGPSHGKGSFEGKIQISCVTTAAIILSMVSVMVSSLMEVYLWVPRKYWWEPSTEAKGVIFHLYYNCLPHNLTFGGLCTITGHPLAQAQVWWFSTCKVHTFFPHHTQLARLLALSRLCPATDPGQPPALTLLPEESCHQSLCPCTPQTPENTP